MDELMEQFVLEARELAQAATDDILALERDPKAQDRLENLFRAIHTLKGSVGLFDFGPMNEVLHAAEEMLSTARHGDLEIDGGFVDPLLGVIEWTERCVGHIELYGELSQGLVQESVQLLASLSGTASPPEDSEKQVPPGKEAPWAAALLALHQAEENVSLIAFRYVPHPQSFFNGDDPLSFVAQIPGLLSFSMQPREPWPTLHSFDPYKCNLVLEGVARAAEAELVSIFRLIPDQVTFVERKPPATLGSRESVEKAAVTMRVDAARIDHLVAIAGELVTAKNALLPLASEARRATGDDQLSRRILASHKDIERLVGELYTAVTKARLVTLDQTFRRFPRLVRETASRLGKSVELVMAGGELEADREIVESLFEPLLHLVRNSLDHGIESEAERRGSGKSTIAKLSLLASRRGDHINLVVSDDGRGLDPHAIRTTARAKGLLSSAEAETLSEKESIEFIFAPGFSTASSVTDLSGRGVGLDAVREAIHRLGGRLELDSAAGHRTTFTLQVPISFAMSRLIVVEVGGERFGIPLEIVAETVRLKPESIIPVHCGEAFVLRDRTLPLVRLAKILGRPDAFCSGDLRVLVCIVEGHQVGIAVDAVAERTETLTRPLSPMLKAIGGILGTTLTGDGQVLLVLDLEVLIG